jgi:hypothetical protein
VVLVALRLFGRAKPKFSVFPGTRAPDGQFSDFAGVLIAEVTQRLGNPPSGFVEFPDVFA